MRIPRDFTKVLQAKREIDLRTRSESLQLKKFSRKVKHKKKNYEE